MFPQPGMSNEFIQQGKHLVGFAFGGDATTEHEVGTKPLHEAFGTRLHELGKPQPWLSVFKPAVSYGIAARTATKVPSVYRGEQDDLSYLVVSATPLNPCVLPAYIKAVWVRDGEKVGSAWTDEAFVIVGRGGGVKDRLDQIHAAILANKVALGNSRPNLTKIGGFCVYLTEHFPAVEAAKWAAAEKADIEEKQAIRKEWDAKNKDLIPTLKAAGRDWYYLGAAIPDGKIARMDDGTLRTWLNPAHQDEWNCGWFTADELRAWAKGEGPVMITRKGKRT